MGAHIRISSSSGRGIGIAGLGDVDSRRMVVFCHPMPGACDFDPDPTITRRWGVHLMTVDRPGYGSSDPWREGETPDVGIWVDEVAQWLVTSMDAGDDQSAVDYRHQIGIVGWGTGGAYALALARRLAHRADRLALVETPEPTRLRRSLGNGDVDVDPGRLPATIGSHRITRMVLDSAIQGSGGIRSDRIAVARPGWDDALDTIRAETLLVYHPDERRGRRSFDAAWYRRRIPHTATGIVRGGVPIVDGWRHILEHVAPEHGELARDAR